MRGYMEIDNNNFWHSLKIPVIVTRDFLSHFPSFTACSTWSKDSFYLGSGGAYRAYAVLALTFPNRIISFMSRPLSLSSLSLSFHAALFQPTTTANYVIVAYSGITLIKGKY